ncbi:IclR family transcriptional regulator [Variovorax sp. WS11]|uniref:IclR family transcriptional regulator n=1 Tax=Variovorax sp. WS11 TaxID=1105204 RepID=UPI000D0D8D8C|nr:IclR family transcriptional regulator C-terminal domain-containing protein [Variovorax sp. WS11]NDZ16334.1 helix-turn-helix domain-containing protein [Variovorax sp. WS11]PSL81722.1 IclR family transcriptional regulator [Variovorax sp. WS11]
MPRPRSIAATPARKARKPDAGLDSSLFIASVAKCFQVLEALNAAGRAVALTELAALAQLDRSAVQRVTHTLHALGYLRQHPLTRAFTLSGRMLEFGHTVLATDRLREKASPHLEALNRKTGETVNLTEMEGPEIVYVVRFPSLHAVSVDLHVGSRLPVYCSAAGRAILSRLDEAEAMAMLGAVKRTSMTKRTVTDLQGLRAALARARELGYALNDQEIFVGDISIATALTNRAGEPVGAINIAVPSPRWQLAEVLRRLVPQLLKTAREINRELADL